MHLSNTSVSRRRFLATAAAASAAPMFIPRHVLGGEENISANDKITLALIGMGYQMNGHRDDFLRKPDVQVVAVCDVDKNRCEASQIKVNEHYGNSDCKAYVDYTEIMSRDDIDAVVCATPDHWHTIIALDTIKAGKDIYCEKPLTNNLMEAKILMDVANHHPEVIFQTGSQQRACANFRYACELVRNGYLGKIKRIEVSVGGPPKPCDLPGQDMEPGLDWDRWLGPAPMRSYSSVLSPRGVHHHFPSWRAYCEYGGGGMTDWGAHHFDIAQWGLGMDNSGPVEIVPPENPKRGRGVKFIYDNGVEVIHGGGPNGLTFYGTEGELFVSRGKLESTPEEIIKQPIGDDEIHLYEAPGDSHAGHRQDWINCVKSRKQPNCPAEIGARTIAVCHLGNVAYLHADELGGKSLRWDPIQWKFVDNPDANRWQDYPYPRREGFELPTV